MFSKIKNAFAKGKKKLLTVIASSFMTVTALAVSASAESSGGGAASDSGLEQIVNTAGATLKAEFVTLVSTLVPGAIGIGVVGLGLYACIYLFKIAKKYFAAAAK